LLRIDDVVLTCSDRLARAKCGVDALCSLLPHLMRTEAYDSVCEVLWRAPHERAKFEATPSGGPKVTFAEIFSFLFGEEDQGAIKLLEPPS
jgi:hypothetical protein